MNAARISPVVSYFLVTRIVEPNLLIRSRVVEILSSVLTIDEEGFPAPEDVRNSLRLYLAAIRTRQIYALLQVSAEYNELESCIALLLSASSFGGNHLVSILEERKKSQSKLPGRAKRHRYSHPVNSDRHVTRSREKKHGAKMRRFFFLATIFFFFFPLLLALIRT